MNRLSTRARLVAMMLAVSLLALLTAVLVLMALEAFRMRDQLARELSALGRLVGSRSSAALVFRDDRTANENLAALRGLAQVAWGCLFDEAGRRVAAREAQTADGCRAESPIGNEHVRFDGALVQVQMPVLLDSRVVGAVALRSTYQPLWDAWTRQAWSIGIAAAAAAVLAALLAWRLQRIIADPVHRVRDVANQVIERGDVRLRVGHVGDDDIGQMARAFDRMLETIDAQQRRLASREAYALRLFHDSHVAQVVVDATDGRIADCNAAAARLFGLEDREAALGRPLDALSAPAEAPGRGSFTEEIARLGEPGVLSAPWTFVRPDGTAWRAEVDLVAFRDGERALVHASVTDITQRLEAERLRSAQQAAEAANRAKTEFLSRMSHELRTPLNAMAGFVQLVEREAADRLAPEHRRWLALSRQSSWHLLALINDVLDVSRIEAGHLQVDLRPVELAPVLRESLEMCRVLAEQQDVALQEPPADEARWVLADPVRLRQVLLNLLTNAIKYNHAGGRVSLSVGASGTRRVRIEVRDDGLGMDAEQMAHLFEPFNRLGRERSTTPGTGIGLALSRELLLRMGARLVIDSAPGAGTRATVDLEEADRPAAPARGVDAPGETDGAASLGTVLYVEDNEINQILVRECLSRLPGLRLELAYDGQEALARLLAGPAPDLILLDMQLPDCTGLELFARIRGLPGVERSRVVALSASAMPEEVAVARAAGMSDYWTKPIDLDAFPDQVLAALAPPDGRVR